MYGVTIETLDNPGWFVSIDLIHTPLSDRQMSPLRDENSEDDWLVCEVENKQFRGQGDPAKLSAILQVFQEFVSQNAAVR